MRIAVKGSFDKPGTVLIKPRTALCGLASRNISESSSLIHYFSCSSIKSRQIFSFVACSGQIAPSIAACISSIGCLQRLCTKGVTSKVSPGCSMICSMMKREDFAKNVRKHIVKLKIGNGKTVESTIFHTDDLIRQFHTESQKVTKLPYIRRWYKAWFDHITHKQVKVPFRILSVGLVYFG